MLYDGAEQLGNLLQILLRILVEEAVLVEKRVEHARIDLLLLLLLTILKLLHGLDELFNFRVYLRGFC